MPKYVIGCANAGLCNRIGNLLSSERIARMIGADFRYSWPVNEWCGCHYGDLFQWPLNEDLAPMWETRSRMITLHDTPDTCYEVDRNCDTDILMVKSWAALGFKGERLDDIYRGVNWDLIRPRGDIEEQIERLALAYDIHNRIGVHIRATDHPMRYQASLEQVKSIFRKLDGETVFLATDCPSAEFQAMRFDGVVSFPKNSRNRATVAGMRESLIDLRLLSMAKRIVGTKWSTFTTIAGRWGGHPVDLWNPDA
jgi:hypothetical protein